MYKTLYDRLTRKNIRKLSYEFSEHVSKDLAKNVIIPPKIILEGMNLWPGKENVAIKLINYVVLMSLIFMEWGHVSYVINVITDISKMASACTTVFSTFQTMCKLISLRYFKKRLNDILVVFWYDFWPVEYANEDTKKSIESKIVYIRTICLSYLFIGLISVTQFMAYPMVVGNGMLPLASKYPFSYTKVPIFEMFYMWQYFSHYIVVCLLSGHDFFFSAIIMNIVTQFQILQDVLKSIYCSDDPNKKKLICKALGIDLNNGNGTINPERELFIKCVKHHILLLTLCEQVEKCFSAIIFIQFFVSSIALCVSSLVLTTNPSEMSNMMTYVMAHLLQLFIVCSVGNELIYQSTKVADAAVECGYHLKFDKQVRHGIIMMVQRSQKPIKLTALGFTDLSYRSFIMLLRMSFSFYTMLSSFN